MGNFLSRGIKKFGRKLKRGAKKLGENLKKHGSKILGLGALFIPGVGGLLGKALGGGSAAAAAGGAGGLLGNLGSGVGLFGKAGGFLSGKVGGMIGKGLGMLQGGGQSGGGGGLLSSALGGMGSMYSPNLSYNADQIMQSYGLSREKAEELEQYYKDLANPDSAVSQQYLAMLQQGSMDQAAISNLMAERNMPGGVASGISAERENTIYGNAPKQAQAGFNQYMSGMAGMAGRGLASTLPLYSQMDNDRASLAYSNQRMGMYDDMNRASAINELGGGLLDYGLEQLGIGS